MADKRNPENPLPKALALTPDIFSIKKSSSAITIAPINNGMIPAIVKPGVKNAVIPRTTAAITNLTTKCTKEKLSEDETL